MTTNAQLPEKIALPAAMLRYLLAKQAIADEARKELDRAMQMVFDTTAELHNLTGNELGTAYDFGPEGFIKRKVQESAAPGNDS